MNFKLPFPPVLSEYFQEDQKTCTEQGIKYQEIVRDIYEEAETTNPILWGLFSGIKLDVVVHPENKELINLQKVMGILIHSLRVQGCIEGWIYEQSISHSGKLGGYLNVKITESKIEPPDIIHRITL